MGVVEASAATPPRVSRPRPAWQRWPFWTGIAISALCIWLVVGRVDWNAFTASLREVQAGWLVAGALASVGATTVSAVRWQRLVHHQTPVSYRDAFESLTIGNFTNLVLPSRAGDLLRAVLVARDAKTRVGRTLASVVIERYADLMMLLSFALALTGAVAFPGPVKTALMLLAGGMLASLVVLYVAGERVARIVVRLIARMAPPPVAERVARLAQNFIDGLSAAGGAGTLLTTVALSAGTWLLWGMSAIFMLNAFALPVPWYAGLFVMVVVNLGGLIPASPGSIGVYHYLAVLALSVWVQNAGAALGYAVVSHATAFMVTTLLGTWSLARRGLTLGAAARTGEMWLAER
jgi:uncharacterized protein (TIRG00374 family)